MIFQAVNFVNVTTINRHTEVSGQQKNNSLPARSTTPEESKAEKGEGRSLYAHQIKKMDKITVLVLLKKWVSVQTLTMIYKAINGLVGIHMDELEHTSRCTRQEPDAFIILQSRVDAYKFSFFPNNSYRLELPSQFSQINTICELLQDGPRYQCSLGAPP